MVNRCEFKSSQVALFRISNHNNYAFEANKPGCQKPSNAKRTFIAIHYTSQSFNTIYLLIHFIFLFLWNPTWRTLPHGEIFIAKTNIHEYKK